MSGLCQTKLPLGVDHIPVYHRVVLGNIQAVVQQTHTAAYI